MKTHDLASALQMLSVMLKRMPNQPLEELNLSVPRGKLDPSNIPAALTTLVSLADFDKAQWSGLIREYGFAIDVRPRDASRDVIGKILKYLEANPDARKRLATSTRTRSGTSPELMKALDLLLKS